MIDEQLRSLNNFWTALKEYSAPIQENTLIQLPEGVFILGNRSIGSSIFVRPCYPKLLKISLDIVNSANTPNLIILGTPGIGKTYFGYFILLHLARLGATVIYESALQKEYMYLFTPDDIVVGNRAQFGSLLSSASTFYIADGLQPVSYAARTILLTSLRRDIWHQFSKTSCTMRYMPVWSSEEIFNCRSLLFDSLDCKLVERLYLQWGGIARYVLKFGSDSVQQSLLKAALNVTNINSVVESTLSMMAAMVQMTANGKKAICPWDVCV